MKAFKVCLRISVEPFLFLSGFAISLVTITNITFTMKMICSTEKNYSDNICDNFLQDKRYVEQKIIIQQSSNNWGILNSVVTVLPAVFLSLLFGPWSDKYGRRLPMFIPLVGAAISSAMLVTIAYVDYKFLPYIITLSTIPIGIAGYSPTLIGMSYIADITSHNDRSIKFIFAEGVIMLGNPLGSFLAGYLQKKYGFGPVYILALASQLTALVYGMVFLKETRGIGNEDTWKPRMRYFLNPNTLKESFKACYRIRPGNDRMFLLFFLSSMFSYMFFINNTKSINVLGGFIGIFQAILPPLLRSSIAKIVNGDEIGKVFALFTSIEFATPIFASISYAQVYNHTVHFFPSCCYFMAGYILIWPLITFT
ncbi:Proton-coupled folate transporter [Nymphon striatum]|nr:Proton-coupled folate transporter [Nymphon striatum]